jgi:acetyltransferase-like isoleucine patch superfamily enzyme
MTDDLRHFMAKGNALRRIWSSIWLMPAWFAPHTSIRVLFHRLRGVDIGKGVEIGYFCIIGNVNPNMIHIGDKAVITARVTLLEHDNAHYYTHGGAVRCGDVHIGVGAFIGIGSVVMPGVTIGARAIVGALSIVKADVPGKAIVAGIPARIIKQL